VAAVLRGTVLRYFLVALATIVLHSACAIYAQPPASLDELILPPGFSIEVYSDDVPNARSMALGDAGTVFVGTRRDGRVYALVPQDSGRPRVVTIAKDLRMPNGIAFHEGSLFVAEMSRIIRYDAIENSLDDIPEPVVIIDSLPGESYHGWRYIAFGPDQKLYISIGAPCNVCDREGFGNISRINADGTGLEIFANGVRNSVGFTWYPASRDMWFTDNGRDMLGDDTPPGELNRATSAGMHFGFPFCHGGVVKDPEFGDQRDCSEFAAPIQKLGPHVAPLGVKFYTGDMFPEEYRGQVFIAEHRSWNRSQKTGYRIALVRIEDGEPKGVEAFAEGWLQGDQVSGRPVDILVLNDGSMLISDDKEGRIYRVTYSRPLSEGVAESTDDDPQEP
jgi:glucose/arabinose dehydrogenase